MEGDRKWTRGKVLSPGGERPEAARNRSGELATIDRRDLADPWNGRRGCAVNWWQRLWRRQEMEEQLEKELCFHLDEHTNQLIAQGSAPDLAQRNARLALGGPEQVKEKCRDARGTR